MSFLAGGRFWRAGRGGRGRGQSLPAVDDPASHHAPLKDAGVLPTHGEEVGVAVGEADVGDVAAVAVVLVARRLQRNERKSLKKKKKSLISTRPEGKRVRQSG